MKIRDRIKQLIRVKAGDLIPNEKNWRTHPKKQRDALQGILAEIGYADALIAYETPSGLKLIDGHLRAETTPDTKVPVLVLDVTEEEASKLLASLDPMSAMAEVNHQILDDLLRDVHTESEALAGMLTALHEKHLREQMKEMSKDTEEQPDEELPSDDYSQFTIPLTAGQEHDVREALKLAKKVFKTDSSGEALSSLVQDWKEIRAEIKNGTV